LLETYSGLKPDDLRNLTQRQYNSLLNQVSNICNYKSGGKLEMETPKDRMLRLKKMVNNKLNNG